MRCHLLQWQCLCVVSNVRLSLILEISFPTNRLGGVTIEESLREVIIGIFKGILYSFTYALSIKESGPGGRNTRYFSIIDGQNRLIESLRLLLEHRENAYAENEELVRSVWRYNKSKKLVIPYRDEGRVPWDVYSAKDDRFILSPFDGPTALSMRVSLLAPPLQGRPDANLELDPHWQRFFGVSRKKRGRAGRETRVCRKIPSCGRPRYVNSEWATSCGRTFCCRETCPILCSG